MKLNELANLIDHTNIRPQASYRDIERLCGEARRYKFGYVCVNPFYVKQAVRWLRGTKVKTVSTCGFPLGANSTEIKAAEAGRAIADGAGEIDMVINIGALKSNRNRIVLEDIKKVVRVCHNHNVLCKVILEMNLLTTGEKITAGKIAGSAGADFLKTGTGIHGPAKVDDVRLMSRIAGGRIQIKAAGGIRTLPQVKRFLAAGAVRIGTSNGAGIIKDFKRYEGRK